MYDHTFSKLANKQFRHQAAHEVSCQPGDCVWSLESSSGVCVAMYGLTYSLYHPEGIFAVKPNRDAPAYPSFQNLSCRWDVNFDTEGFGAVEMRASYGKGIL